MTPTSEAFLALMIRLWFIIRPFSPPSTTSYRLVEVFDLRNPQPWITRFDPIGSAVRTHHAQMAATYTKSMWVQHNVSIRELC